MRPVAQLERGVEMLVLAGLDQVDRVMIGAAAQEREDSRPSSPTPGSPAHRSRSLVTCLTSVSEERDVAELVRHDPLARKRWLCGSGRLNTSMTVPFGSSNVTISAIVGSGSFLRTVLMPWPAVCFSKASRSSSGPSWNPSRMHCAMRALAQNDRMMIDRVSEIDGVLLLADQRQARGCRCNTRPACRDRAFRSWHARSSSLRSYGPPCCRLSSALPARQRGNDVDHGGAVAFGKSHLDELGVELGQRGRAVASRRRRCRRNRRSCRR